MKDWLPSIISSISLVISLSVGCIQFLNWKSNRTKIIIEQVMVKENQLSNNNYYNSILLNREQSREFLDLLPYFYLVVNLKIKNLSHLPITITNFIFSDSISYVPSSYINETDKKFGVAYYMPDTEFIERINQNINQSFTPMSMSSIEPEKERIIYPGARIESKDVISGCLILECGLELYDKVEDGKLKITIETTDKNYNIYVNIKKTGRPVFHFEREKQNSNNQ